MHAPGANVVLHYRGADKEAAAIEAELNAVRATARGASRPTCSRTARRVLLVRTAVERFGRLDVLVNNASSFFPTAIGEIEDEALGGAHRHQPERAAAPLAGRGAASWRSPKGSIVNIVDIHAERPLKGYVVYTIAKAGLAALTRSLAMELAPAGARERRCAGRDRVARGRPVPADERERIIDDTLLKRLGEADDIASAVHFLARTRPTSPARSSRWTAGAASV